MRSAKEQTFLWKFKVAFAALWMRRKPGFQAQTKTIWNSETTHQKSNVSPTPYDPANGP